MNTLKEYDVLRLIEHNRICYVSSDNVKGCPLARWIKYKPNMSKEQMFRWIHDIIRQLIQIHKCRGNPCYQYVNPYSIIVTEEENLCFLDIGTESNKEILRMMQRRNIREYFLPEEERFQQKGSEELDIFGFGKTVQYLFTFVEIEPGFTKKEEKRFQKLIAKCIGQDSRKAFQRIEDVKKYLPEVKRT